MEILEGSRIAESPVLTQFVTAYQAPELQPGILKTAGLVEGDGSDPDQMSVILLRLFVQDSQRLRGDGQKFIIGFKFSNFGDMVSCDLISLDLDHHRDMVAQHLKWMRDFLPTLSAEAERLSFHDALTESYLTPIVYTGGYVKMTEDGQLSFFGSSGDFSDLLLGTNSIAAAAFVAQTCGLAIDGDASEGESFFQGLLEFLGQTQRRPDFYEQLVTRTFEMAPSGEGNRRFTMQQLGGLITMKATDRWKASGVRVGLGFIVEESSGGLAGHIMREDMALKLSSV